MKEYLNEYPTLATVMMTVLALLPLLKLGHYILASNRSFRIQSLDLLFKSLSDQANGGSRLVVEQMFRSHFKLYVSYDLIQVLLDQPNPTKAIELYKTSKKYLVLSDNGLVFDAKYQCQKRRKIERLLRPTINFIKYWLLAMIGGLSGLYVVKSYNLEIVFEVNYLIFNGAIWFLASLLSFVSMVFAVKSLTDETNIKDAELLEKSFSEQNSKENKWYY
ncbi:hypothetical protein L4D09_24195 [Photobacterium makurazakiensis]|uniref:hypothetical protein n=1 Tax=Photobacterium makurazakiensis TaxID=2910234 RepID=UPI003D14AC60